MAVAEEQKKKKEPFSPLQTGCAFVMLTNMIIYLAVVAFVFNMLDPSKLNASYLAKRGFSSPEEESQEDKDYQHRAERKRKEQLKFQQKQADTSLNRDQFSSPAAKLSEIEAPPRISDQAWQNSTPHAALTPDRPKGYGKSISAKSRQYFVPIYPQATLRSSHSMPRKPEGRLINPEPYDTVVIELAPGIEYPTFRIPALKRAGETVYSPSDGVPDPLAGAPRITAPPMGAESIRTNRTEKAGESEKTDPAKDTL